MRDLIELCVSCSTEEILSSEVSSEDIEGVYSVSTGLEVERLLEPLYVM